MAKKLISLLVIFALLACSAGNVFASTGYGNVSSWATNEIDRAHSLGLIPETFIGKNLSEPVTRAEFAAIAVQLYEKLTGKEALSAGVPFTDISGNENEQSILKSYSLDIVLGTSETVFSPDTSISREDLATMLFRVFKKYAWEGWSLKNDIEIPDISGTAEFEDGFYISSYAIPAVYFMVKHGVINGIGNNCFAPNSLSSSAELCTATREQAIAIALRSYEKLFTEEVINNSKSGVTTEFLAPYEEYRSGLDMTLEEAHFSRGMAFADLNDDKKPELIALCWEHESHGFDIVDGKVVPTAEENHFVYHPYPGKTDLTKYMDSHFFCGIYKEKSTGVKTIISYIIEFPGVRPEMFRLVTFDGEKYHTKDVAGSSIDEIMADYELADEQLVSSYAIHGLFLPSHSLYDAFYCYMMSDKNPEYQTAPDGEAYYYIRNIYEDRNETQLIPARTMTGAEFAKICEYNDNAEITNYIPEYDRYLKDLYSTDDGYLVRKETDEYGYINTTVEYYYFVLPENPDDTIVILDYMNNTPVTANYTRGFSADR